MEKNKANIIYPNFTEYPLIPVIIQDFKTKQVLMLGYTDKKAYKLTLEHKEVHFFSRSRNKIWKKGELSGHIQKIKRIFFDCDNDTILIQVKQIGNAACHKGYKSCFHKELKNKNILENVNKKLFDPKIVYSITKNKK